MSYLDLNWRKTASGVVGEVPPSPAFGFPSGQELVSSKFEAKTEYEYKRPRWREVLFASMRIEISLSSKLSDLQKLREIFEKFPGKSSFKKLIPHSSVLRKTLVLTAATLALQCDARHASILISWEEPLKRC